MFIFISVVLSLDAIPKEILLHLEDLESVKSFPCSLIYTFSTVSHATIYTIIMPLFVLLHVQSYRNICKRILRDLTSNVTEIIVLE